MAIQRISEGSQFAENTQPQKDNLILKAMEEEFGFTAAQSIISHVSRTTMKSKVEIFSDYDTFASILKLVYTEEVAEKEILERLTSFGLSQNT